MGPGRCAHEPGDVALHLDAAGRLAEAGPVGVVPGEVAPRPLDAGQDVVRVSRRHLSSVPKLDDRLEEAEDAPLSEKVPDGLSREKEQREEMRRGEDDVKVTLREPPELPPAA